MVRRTLFVAQSNGPPTRSAKGIRSSLEAQNNGPPSVSAGT